jgi:hypothetical protein
MRPSVIAFFLWVLTLSAAGQSSAHPCDLPKGLDVVIEANYPGTKVVNVSDINEDDREFFLKDHAGSCPGLIPVDFYGDGKPTFALALATRQTIGFNTKLVVAHRLGAKWKTLEVDKTGVPAPVIWGEDPREYVGVYGNKIRATRPVIFFVGYESWAVLYAWDGQKIKHIQMMD